MINSLLTLEILLPAMVVKSQLEGIRIRFHFFQGKQDIPFANSHRSSEDVTIGFVVFVCICWD